MYFATHCHSIPFISAQLSIHPIASYHIAFKASNDHCNRFENSTNQKKQQQQQQIVIFLDIILYYYTCIPKCQSRLTYALAVSVVRQPNTLHVSHLLKCISIKMLFIHMYEFKFQCVCACVSLPPSLSPHPIFYFRQPHKMFLWCWWLVLVLLVLCC